MTLTARIQDTTAALVMAAVALSASTAFAQLGPPQQGQSHGTLTPSRTIINNGQTGQPAQGQNNQPITPRVPREFQLTPDQQKYLDQVLGYWQFRSEKVGSFRCKFQRWEYSPAHVRDPNTPYTVADGVIKYSKPDKGMYQVDVVKFYHAPQQQGEQPQWKPREGNFGEHWVCDGKSIFEFDHRLKQLKESRLPPHMQGVAIADGPLPFLFGAKVDKLKQRYWMKPLVPPENSKGEYWLLAVPKTRQDAQNFHRVELILDQKDFLPTAMQIYIGDNERKVFRFTDREVNPRRRLLEADFAKPKVPRGWKKVVENNAPQGTRNALLSVEDAGRGRLPIPLLRRQ